ncbi:hypothetical protein [Streptomyces shenzhenensis]|uniref:hypothetical protein n=1 Tax=Streptomyces shenzhenensis TaxID=943815 RepID=UPI003697266C
MPGPLHRRPAEVDRAARKLVGPGLVAQTRSGGSGNSATDRRRLDLDGKSPGPAPRSRSAPGVRG